MMIVYHSRDEKATAKDMKEPTGAGSAFHSPPQFFETTTQFLCAMSALEHRLSLGHG